MSDIELKVGDRVQKVGEPTDWDVGTVIEEFDYWTGPEYRVKFDSSGHATLNNSELYFVSRPVVPQVPTKDLTLKEGDKVEYYWISSWQPGVILEVDLEDSAAPYLIADETGQDLWAYSAYGVRPRAEAAVPKLYVREDEKELSSASVPDMVNEPPHYNSHPKGIECIEVIEDNPFLTLGNAMKYLWRVSWGGKGNDIEDLKKAVWYIEREIHRRGA